MRIRSVEPMVYRMPLENPISDARNTITERSAVLIRIETDDGIVGWGEAASFAGCGELVAGVVRSLSGKLVGEDPTTPSTHYDRLYHGSQHYGRRGLVINALSGIDVALWDILGKVAELPLYKLFGGGKNRIGGGIWGYYNAGYYTENHREFFEESLTMVRERGATASKIKIGRYGLHDDTWRIEKAREILGADRDIMVDANACLEPRTAQYLDDVMFEHRVRWVEEPVPLRSVPALAELRRRLRTPIAGYELEMTLDGWSALIDHRAVDIAQPDAIWSGGITECQRIAHVCAASSIEFIPHNFASLVSLAANAHLSCAAPTGGWLEVDSNTNPFLWELDLESRWSFTDGLIKLPDSPGLGVRPNLELIEPYKVAA